MRIVHAAVAGCLVLATGGCGTGAVTYAAVRPPGKTGDASGVRTLLGRMDALPDTFFSHARAPWRPPFRPRARACRLLFDAAAGRLPREGLSGTAAATYQGAHAGELAGVGVAVYDGDEAAGHLAALRDALAHCATADAGTPYDRLAATRTPPAGIGGADAAARALAGRVGGYPYRMHLVVARSGHTLIALVHAGLTPPDPARTAELTRLLVREVGTLDA
ncbi:hypothetical protein [Microbispora sp. H10836]|uniref:hypothetical protein n=1 Tax=Microbispora sp. H10836 TaxID=2729106 RepID=UPI00147285E7|nr:hypothetical protein [Microbispora sp. H10836]